MAMKDILDRFKREPEEEIPMEPVAEEQPSFVITDINSEPIVPEADAPARSGAVQVGSSNDDRIQMFEIDLGGPKAEPAAEAAEEPPEEPPVYAPPAAPVPETPAVAAEGDYEVDFGYAAPGALDDVTYTTAPETAAPTEPEPVVYQKEPAEEPDSEEYYDSYEPIYNEAAPGIFFAPEASGSMADIELPRAEAPAVEEPAEVETAPAVEETPTYTEDQPRYENYRKDYRKKAAEEGPRTYENNIDETVFLPDEGDKPFSSRKNRRRLTVAILALLAALLLVLGGVLISHFVGRSSDDAALSTSAKVKTTAFERSVSNNSDATETTAEPEEETVQYDENGEISESTSSTASTSWSSRTRTTTRTSTTTTRTTTTSRTTTSRTTTASTAPSTEPSTEAPEPSTDAPQPSSNDPNNPWNRQ